MTANPDTETAIYQWLSQQENKSGAIKALIEREIAGQVAELKANHKITASISRHISRHDERFGLFFVEYESQKRREDLFIALDGTYVSKSLCVDYRAFKSRQRAHLDEWLSDVVTEAQKHQCICVLNVVGFEDLLTQDANTVFEVINNMNWRRSNLKELGLPVFFWTTSEAVTKIAKFAPDLFDWHTDVLTLD